MYDTERYIITWRKYKNNKRILIALFLGFYPMLEWVIRPIYEHYQNDWVINLYVLIWLTFYFIYFIKFSDFNCPQCGKSFAAKWSGFPRLYVGYTMNRCANCGLPKWSLGDSGEFYNN
jgi:hypothetical protein